MIKKTSIVALVLLVLGIGGSMLTLDTQMAQSEMLEEKVVDTNDYHNIDIHTDNTEITILPTNDESTKVELFGNDTKYDLAANVEENTLKINVKTNRDKIFSFDIFPKEIKLTVYIPRIHYENISVKSSNGRIDVKEIEGTEIQLNTDNGNIQLNSVQSETVRLETNNGKVEMSDIVAKLLKIDSYNGKIKMKDIEGEIVGATSNGKISLQTNYLEQPIDLQSDNGKIEIESRNKPKHAILDLKTHNGKVTVFGESDWDTKIGNGENIIKITTTNGNITISSP